jgi:hypothetical protein
MRVFYCIYTKKWIFWFFVVNFISVIPGFQSLFANTNKGFIFAVLAWGLFIWAFSKHQKRKQEDRNRSIRPTKYVFINI